MRARACVRGGPQPGPAPQPTMIYCASALINPLLFLHFNMRLLHTFCNRQNWMGTAVLKYKARLHHPETERKQ